MRILTSGVRTSIRRRSPERHRLNGSWSAPRSPDDDILPLVRAAERLREVDRLRIGGARLLAQPAPDAAHEVDDGLPLPMHRSRTHHDIPFIRDHLDAVRGAHEGALRASDAVLVRHLDPAAKPLRHRDAFRGVPLRGRPTEQVPGHLREQDPRALRRFPLLLRHGHPTPLRTIAIAICASASGVLTKKAPNPIAAPAKPSRATPGTVGPPR